MLYPTIFFTTNGFDRWARVFAPEKFFVNFFARAHDSVRHPPFIVRIIHSSLLLKSENYGTKHFMKLIAKAIAFKTIFSVDSISI